MSNRKLDHIEIALASGGESGARSGWDSLSFVPVALPRLDRADVSLTADFMGHRLAAPILIAGMTGGHADTERVNANLAIAAQACGVAMGVGSQRAALEDPSLAQTYSVVRRHAPDAFILGNIGISQLVSGAVDRRNIDSLIDMVAANAMAVHINLLQELIQPEGQITLSDALPALQRFVLECPVPVLVKETGCGLDRKTALRLRDIGVAALDIGGAGGTSFVHIEGTRAARAGEIRKARLAQTFSAWGLPTLASLQAVRDTGLPIIATGGLRNGLDIAKALAKGGDLAGVGRQMLAAAQQGPDQAIAEMTALIDELTIAMLLTESADIAALRQAQFIGAEDA